MSCCRQPREAKEAKEARKGCERRRDTRLVLMCLLK